MLSNDKNMKMYAFGTVFLIFFIALSIVSLRVVKYRMFNSSKVMGESVAARFVDREMAKIHTQEIVLKGAANNIQEIITIEPDDLESEIELQLKKYTRVVNDVLTIGTADMCAVVNGKVIGDKLWDNTDKLMNLEWYHDVLAEDAGKVVYTNIHRVSHNDRRVLTKAIRLENN